MTSLILNSKAVCCMHMGNFEEAETLLLEALNKVSAEHTFSYSVSRLNSNKPPNQKFIHFTMFLLSL